jgi:filamentous hemagglutinin family protein
MNVPKFEGICMNQTPFSSSFPSGLSGSVATLLGVCVAACLSVSSYGLPVGGQVAAGQAAISTNAKSMTVTAGDRSILNFTKFNIAADESVKFVQPGAKATVLARATDGTPSEIFGRLDANGRVVLANAAGIYFRSGSSVSVGGLVAAAGTVSDDAFLQNSGQLEVRLSGAVESAGQIVSEEHVALLGRTVLNTGSIVAPNGLVALVSGENVLLAEDGGDVAVVQAGGDGGEPKDLADRGSSAVKSAADGTRAGVTHSGNISARSALLGAGDLYAIGVRHTGKTRASKVRVEAAAKVVVSGEIDASSLAQNAEDPQTGGIEISGDTVELNGARLVAQGNVRGGNISVNGSDVALLGGAVLDVSGVDQGSAGEIFISGLNTASVEGSLLARGGEKGGDGGAIFLVSDGQEPVGESLVTDVSAPAGSSGSVERMASGAVFVDGGYAFELDGKSGVDVATDDGGNPESTVVFPTDPLYDRGPVGDETSDFEDGGKGRGISERERTVTLTGGVPTDATGNAGPGSLSLVDGVYYPLMYNKGGVAEMNLSVGDIKSASGSSAGRDAVIRDAAAKSLASTLAQKPLAGAELRSVVSGFPTNGIEGRAFVQAGRDEGVLSAGDEAAVGIFRVSPVSRSGENAAESDASSSKKRR